MPATVLPALISLPDVPADTSLLVLAIVAGLTVVIAARSMLAWQALSAKAAGARRRAARLDNVEPNVHVSLGRVRAAAHALNGSAERALWALPRFDDRVAATRATLADNRALLDELRRDDDRAMRVTFARIHGTLSLLRTAREIRRTIWG